jgi:hypothetical protein
MKLKFYLSLFLLFIFNHFLTGQTYVSDFKVDGVDAGNEPIYYMYYENDLNIDVEAELTIVSGDPYGQLRVLRAENPTSGSVEVLATSTVFQSDFDSFGYATYEFTVTPTYNEFDGDNTVLYIQYCPNYNCDINSSQYSYYFVDIMKLDPFIANAGSNKSIDCGESATIGSGGNVASGGLAPYSFEWSPSSSLSSGSISNPIASPVSTTEYELIVTDANGVRSDADWVTVSINEMDDNFLINGLNEFYAPCPDEVVSYTYNISGVPDNAESLQWDTEYGYITDYYYTNGFITGIKVSAGDFTPAKQPSNNNETNNRTKNLIQNSFQVTCTAINDCGSVEFVKDISLRYRRCMPISPLLKGNKINSVLVYPNTVKNKLNIEFEANYKFKAEINIYNSSGVKVENIKNGYFTKGVNKLNFNNLNIPKGLYFLRIEDNKKVYFSSRIIKE